MAAFEPPNDRNVEARMYEATRQEIIGNLDKLRYDLNVSTASRERLTLLMYAVGVLSILVWVTTVWGIVVTTKARAENKDNTQLGRDIITQVCQSYTQRTGDITDLCLDYRTANR